MNANININVTVPNATLIVADFEALYTNIDHNHAIVLISDFMKDKLNSKYLSPKAFKTLLQLVLENNYFTFNFKFWILTNENLCLLIKKWGHKL